MHFFSKTFKYNIAQVPPVIDDKFLKPFTEVVHGFADRRPRNIEQLKEAIRQGVAAIPPATTRKTMDNFREWLQDFFINNGRHLSDVIFKVFEKIASCAFYK